MKLKLDRQADALYLTLDESAVTESEEIAPGVILDYDEQNRVIGIELLHLSLRAPGAELSRLLFEIAPLEPLG
jgi:uncharacterized protein YuzE